MNAAMVAVPTFTTAEVLIPASKVGIASGSSISRMMVDGRSPRDFAASIIPRGIWASPTWVLRTIGSSAYSVSAMNAGTTPMRPVIGIRNASRASDGIVWMTPVTPKTSGAVGRRRAASRPNGMPIAQLAASAANTSPTCSSVSRPKVGRKQ